MKSLAEESSADTKMCAAFVNWLCILNLEKGSSKMHLLLVLVEV